ncbi:hypothetical protein HK098_003641 [Nowakowskiella sp. JEL0407]|nr:hypothetical protein HK098_003641 [Nowakowskiella sp. JEL0407]
MSNESPLPTLKSRSVSLTTILEIEKDCSVSTIGFQHQNTKKPPILAFQDTVLPDSELFFFSKSSQKCIHQPNDKISEKQRIELDNRTYMKEKDDSQSKLVFFSRPLSPSSDYELGNVPVGETCPDKLSCGPEIFHDGPQEASPDHQHSLSYFKPVLIKSTPTSNQAKLLNFEKKIMALIEPKTRQIDEFAFRLRDLGKKKRGKIDVL